MDDRLFSPYSDDEAVDVESLYQSLRARRRARGGPAEFNPTEYAELFLLTGKDNAKVENIGTRWQAFLDGFFGFLE
jgi:hypothetical protein